MLSVTLTFTTLALCLSALASASPLHHRNLSPDEFPLILSGTTYGALPLVAVTTSTSGQLNLVFQDPSGTSGTPAYLNATYLDLDIGTAEPWSIYLPEIGEIDGAYEPVIALPGFNGGSPGWVVSDGSVGPPLTNGDQLFLACNEKLDESELLVLNWFNYAGSIPDGCVIAELTTV